MAAGRPTEYEALAVIQKVGAYMEDCKKQSFLPTVEGLAVYLGVARQTLYDWADPNSDRFHEEFSDIFELLKAQQAAQLIQNGLANNYNSTITKLMLTKHGYKDRTDVTTGDEAISVAGFNIIRNEGDNPDNQTHA